MLAQIHDIHSWDLTHWIITAIIVIAVIAVFLIYCRAQGIQIPAWIVLFDMAPRLPVNEAPNNSLSDSISTAEILLTDFPSGVKKAYFSHLLLSQLGRSNAFSLWGSPLGRSIGHIVNLCTKKEMLDVDAGRIVARMKHMQTIGDCAISQFPCYAMRPDISFADTDEAIAEIVLQANPEDAAFFGSRSDVLLETDSQRNCSCRIPAQRGAESAMIRILGYVAWNSEFDVTHFANAEELSRLTWHAWTS